MCVVHGLCIGVANISSALGTLSGVIPFQHLACIGLLKAKNLKPKLLRPTSTAMLLTDLIIMLSFAFIQCICHNNIHDLQ